MPIWEFRLWWEFSDKYPEGWRAEVAGANVTSIIANVNRDPKKSRKPIMAKDLSPVAAMHAAEEKKKGGAKALFDSMKALSQ